MELGDPEADVRKTPQHRMYTSGNAGYYDGLYITEMYLRKYPAGDSLSHPRESHIPIYRIPSPTRLANVHRIDEFARHPSTSGGSTTTPL